MAESYSCFLIYPRMMCISTPYFSKKIQDKKKRIRKNLNISKGKISNRREELDLGMTPPMYDSYSSTRSRSGQK